LFAQEFKLVVDIVRVEMIRIVVVESAVCLIVETVQLQEIERVLIQAKQDSIADLFGFVEIAF
jgi:hypothetical protein